MRDTLIETIGFSHDDIETNNFSFIPLSIDIDEVKSYPSAYVETISMYFHVSRGSGIRGDDLNKRLHIQFTMDTWYRTPDVVTKELVRILDTTRLKIQDVNVLIEAFKYRHFYLTNE